MSAQLDYFFGPLIPAQKPPHPSAKSVEKWEEEHKPMSITVLSESTAPPLRTFIESINQNWLVGSTFVSEAIIIWSVLDTGYVSIAVEEVVWNGLPVYVPKHQKFELTRRIPKLGHPSLVSHEQKLSRISGEIAFNTERNPKEWEINNLSGRYGRHKSRRLRHVQNAADIFSRFEIDLKPEFYD